MYGGDLERWPVHLAGYLRPSGNGRVQRSLLSHCNAGLKR